MNAFKETKIKFSGWLKSIAKTYGVVNQVEPDAFQVKSQDRDTAIAMLKALHPRKRVTVNEISDQMGISVRAVQKIAMSVTRSAWIFGVSYRSIPGKG